MNSQTFVSRSSGVSLIVAGLALVSGNVLHPDQKADALAALTSPAWVPVHLAILASAILFLYGLVGYQARQEARSGALGKLGYMLTFIGSALFVGALTVDGLVAPALATAHADAALEGGPLLVVFMLTAVVFAVGIILLAIATLRANVFPRWPVIVLAVGGILTAFGDPLPHLPEILAGIVFGIGMLGMGYSLLTTPRSVLQPQVAL